MSVGRIALNVSVAGVLIKRRTIPCPLRTQCVVAFVCERSPIHSIAKCRSCVREVAFVCECSPIHSIAKCRSCVREVAFIL